MIGNTNSYESTFTPKFGSCNDVKVGNDSTRKIIWLVPHVIKHSGDAEIITWRCNWGNVCKSECQYAMSGGRTKDTRVAQEFLPKTSLSFMIDET